MNNNLQLKCYQYNNMYFYHFSIIFYRSTLLRHFMRLYLIKLKFLMINLI